jgi:hypothetical protein
MEKKNMEKKNQERKSLKLMIRRVRVSAGVRAGTGYPVSPYGNPGYFSGGPSQSDASY